MMELLKNLVKIGEELNDSPNSFIISVFRNVILGISETEPGKDELVERASKIVENYKVLFDELYTRR